LIPIWNIYVYFKIAGRKNWFWVLFITPILWIIVSLIFWLIGNATMHTVYADSWDLDSINQSQEIQGWANAEISTLNCYGSCPTCNCG
jgi:hypothetical protein